jgi:2-desacetyl-2-hydroxyethyl bacteriochlorophyllide A dehydrogenase
MAREDVGTIATTVRGRCQIAHSFRGKLDIPLHGITYVVDATFAARGDELVIPLADVDALLSSVLQRYDRTNLDCDAEFADENTTCERVARAVWEGCVASASPHEWAATLAHLLVRVRESDEAFVEYGRAVGAAAAGGASDAAAGEYAVAVRARCMVGRSLDHAGADRTCEGATLIIDALFCGSALDPEAGFLFDICLGERLLREVVEPLHQRHLRDISHPQLRAYDSASLARMICLDLARKLASEEAAKSLARLRVIVRESDVLAAEAECGLPITAPAGVEWKGRCALLLEGSGGPRHLRDSWPLPHVAIRVESNGVAGGSAYCGRAALALQEALTAQAGLAPGRDLGLGAVHTPQTARASPEIDSAISGASISGVRAFGSDASPDAAAALAALSRRLCSRLCPALCSGEGQHPCSGDAAAGSAPRIHSGGSEAPRTDWLEVKLCTAGRRSVAFGRATPPSPHPPQILVLDIDAMAAAETEARTLSRASAATERMRVARLPGPMAAAVRAETEAALPAWEDLPADVSRASGATPTGIAHHTPLAQLLQAAPASLVAVSSCQSEAQARDAITALGLSGVPWRHVLTPRALAAELTARERDVSAGTQGDGRRNEPAEGPPKVYALAPPKVYGSSAFWFDVVSLLSRRSPSDIVLISDSPSLAAASAAGQDARLPPLSPAFPVTDAVLSALHCRSPMPRSAQAYLKAKRRVDERARSQAVVGRLIDALAVRRGDARDIGEGAGVRHTAGGPCGVRETAGGGASVCRVIDVGAGSLSLLPVVTRAVEAAGYAVLIYDAIDSDGATLLDAAETLAGSSWERVAGGTCHETSGDAHAMPEERVMGADSGEPPGGARALPGERVASLHLPSVKGSMEVHLELRRVDVRALASARAAGEAISKDGTSCAEPFEPYDLLVASAFADLMCPHSLLATLVRLAPGALAYLPITFCGRTELVPPSDGAPGLPSDSRVSAAYHAHLRTQGQHFDLPTLLTACEGAGATRLAVEPSDWSINPSDPFFPYMLDFLASGIALSLWRDGFDSAAWRDSVLARAASLSVSNVDLLLHLPFSPCAAIRPRRALEFSAPREVRVVTAAVPADGPFSRETLAPSLGPHKVEVASILSPRQVETSGGQEILERVYLTPLAAGQVLLRSVISMVSSGTELLVYRGQLDASDQPLDASIPGMTGAPPAYPMEYGYSMVGYVTAVGAGAPLSLVGQTAFAFAPHASENIIDAGCVQRIPPDLACFPADAVFLPAAETAISIAHDAHPRLGETAAVFGAGVIGLLTAAALVTAGATVTVFDPREGRLRVALSLGAHRVAPPSEAPRSYFDVCVECSGNPAALQSAVDATADGGRVVIASWYGNKPVALALGTRFHRSHVQLIASQVSRIPASHGANMTKHKRFGAAWQLIRRLRPALTIPLRTVPLEEAAEAYAALDAGEAIVCHLVY